MKIGQALQELSQQSMQEQDLLLNGLSEIKKWFAPEPEKKLAKGLEKKLPKKSCKVQHQIKI